MQIGDFANALRQMADNADLLADRHDLRHAAQLYQQVDELNAQAQRDGDLIAELRRQVEGMSRSLDAVARIRRRVIDLKATDAVQILADALLIIDGGCECFTRGSCRDSGSGRTRVAEFTAEQWCQSCVAHDALERAGALPAEVDS